MRKASRERLHKGMVGSHHDIQITEALFLAKDMLTTPDRWDKHAVFERLFEDVRGRVASGDERPSFSATLIKAWIISASEQLASGDNVWRWRRNHQALYAGGCSPWCSTLMSRNAELDQIVGRDRLPSFADFERLPYIRAMVKETLRWRPVGPLGFPHRLTEDDRYEGYFIPKGTIVMANVWHLNHNPDIYGADSDDFYPARHLGTTDHDHAPGPAATKDENHVTYGFGWDANNSLFVDTAMMLWATNIDRHLDANGRLTAIDVNGCIDNGTAV